MWSSGGATRVEFDPPSLRQGSRRRVDASTPGNEGRIRPSFIEAASAHARHGFSPANEGRIRPSFIEARFDGEGELPAGYNEGRIRPSFIEARNMVYRKQDTDISTRVEFDPPSLRPVKGFRLSA